MGWFGRVHGRHRRTRRLDSDVRFGAAARSAASRPPASARKPPLGAGQDEIEGEAAAW